MDTDDVRFSGQIHTEMPAVDIYLPYSAGADLGEGCRGCAPPPLPPPEMTCGFLIQLVLCKKNLKQLWFIGVEVEQETSALPPKKSPASAPAVSV